MDVSYEKQQVDNVVADLNRMKQGMACPSIVGLALIALSSRKSHYQRHQVYVEEKGRKKDNRIRGCID